MLSEFGIKYVMQNIFDFFDSIFFLVCVRNDIYEILFQIWKKLYVDLYI